MQARRRPIGWRPPFPSGWDTATRACFCSVRAKAANVIWAKISTLWPAPPPRWPSLSSPCAAVKWTAWSSQAELRALQSQINPHFLFNALNTLYGTIPRESSAARRIVLNLAEIFRYFLQSDKTFVPLSHEMQIVRAYLEVEQSRLGNRLRVEIDVADAALEISIPVLSIQPLVENAIKHGIALSSEAGYVRVHAGFEDGQLRIEIANSRGDGVTSVPGTGVGLQNVRRRLEICYGPGSDLRLSLNPGNATVELRIPVANGRTGWQTADRYQSAGPLS